MRFGLISSSLLSALISIAQSEEPVRDLEQIVRQLGAEDYAARKQAFHSLIKIGLPARKVLEAHKNDSDAEIGTRVAELLNSPYMDENQAAFYEFLAKELGPVFGAKEFGPHAFQSAACVGVWEAEPPKEIVDADGKVTESATDNGLDWLCHNQEADGRWDSVKYGAQVEADLVQTALALCCFLQAGHSEKVGKYRENIRRAIAWLIQQQAEDGRFVRVGQEVQGTRQAVASVALCMAASNAKISATHEAAQKAVNYALEHQSQKDGKRDGWGRAKHSQKPDILTTAYFLMSLKLAKETGLIVPADSFDGASRFLDRIDDRAAHAFRHIEDAKPSLQATALGVMCRYILAGKQDDLRPYVDAGRLSSLVSGTDFCDVVLLWPATYACFATGGDHWKIYHERMISDLIMSQGATGKAKGSWSSRGIWSGMGKVGGTAVSYLPLTVYKAYMPPLLR